VGLHTVSRALSVTPRWRGQVRPFARLPIENLNSSRAIHRVFFEWHDGHPLLDKSERGGFVTETHIDEREISNEVIIFRLFVEESFQFAARLSPTFLSGDMITGNFLGPA
jgi:hypothetical protein